MVQHARLAMYKARDVMSTGVVSIPLDSTAQKAIGILLENKISGAPVVDGDGTLVGIVSEFQLLELIYHPELATAPISRFMTKEVLTVGEDTMLSDVAGILVLQRIRRVPVVSEGKLVGLISRRDLLRYVLEARDEIADFISATVAAAR